MLSLFVIDSLLFFIFAFSLLFLIFDVLNQILHHGKSFMEATNELYDLNHYSFVEAIYHFIGTIALIIIIILIVLKFM